jgi:uncharacterized protein
VTRLLGLVAALVLVAAPAFAAPKFPALTGRVVDGASILSPATEAALTDKLAALETSTTRQVVVVTVPSLQGYEIEEYGYQLGRAWGIGQAEDDNGALLIVAPNERKVRIEVGYGLEPILTDALSSVILQTQVLPKFRDGDMEGGVVAGADTIIAQLSLPEAEAKANVAKAAQAGEAEPGLPPLVVFFLIFFIFAMVRGVFGRRRGGMGGALPWIILGGLSGSSRGGGWSGGGGFSGGGGSFGGGGSSGSW